MKGVVDCIVGYSGGMKANPTYRSIKDSTESILIEYDPRIISYSDILNYWKRSAHGYPGMKRQYRSVIFYGNAKQEVLARDLVENMKLDKGVKEIYIDIESLTPFYRAEEYHQHYMKKRFRGE